MKSLVSLLCLAVIFASVVYAEQREHVRGINLHQFYRQINAESFNSQLPDAEIKWSDLTEQKGLTHWMDDGSSIIEVDCGTNPNESELRDTVQHEACHVATLPDIDKGDPHGAAFQECMKRFGR
jgi:predicted SprT family Zn-dependent metalloprotease